MKILILEDNQGHFESILDALSGSEFRAPQVNVYPTIDPTAENIIHNWHMLIEFAQKSNFDPIIAACREVGINEFIIDASLNGGGSDQLGVDFMVALHEKYKAGKDNTILMSNTLEVGQLYSEIPFVSKSEFSENVYPIEIARRLSDKLNKRSSISNHIPSTNEKTSSLGEAVRLFSKYVKKYGFKYAILKTLVFINGNIQRVIDFVVTLVFALVITMASFFALFKIGGDMYNYVFTPSPIKPEGASISESSSFLNLSNDLNGLKSSNVFNLTEHVFLYLLPLFIVFGFFLYYRTNIRVHLLGANTYKINEDTASKAMDTTKILFISSIISYVLIKIIEILFDGVPNHNNQGLTSFPNSFEPKSLIAIGVFLIVLMAYYFIIHSKHGKSEK